MLGCSSVPSKEDVGEHREGERGTNDDLREAASGVESSNKCQ